jgi:uncharacterized membrane protein YfcA
MNQTLLQVLMLFAAGLVAGSINVVAGGGSMITLPLMIFLGLPPTVANGTNRVAILVQNVGAVWGFSRRGFFETPWLRFVAPPAILGALLGTWMGVVIGDAPFQRILAVVMVLVAVWTVWKPPRSGEGAPVDPAGLSRKARTLFLGVFFLVGVFGGFIQAGIGFLILGATSALGLDLVRGNALKVLLVLLFTPLALAGYAMAGRVDWAMGIALACGNLVGSQVGVRFTVLKGHAWVRRVVVVMVVLFALRLLIWA